MITGDAVDAAIQNLFPQSFESGTISQWWRTLGHWPKAFKSLISESQVMGTCLNSDRLT
jgi:hypothetical protein